jgi:hypothetical protein
MRRGADALLFPIQNQKIISAQALTSDLNATYCCSYRGEIGSDYRRIALHDRRGPIIFGTGFKTVKGETGSAA